MEKSSNPKININEQVREAQIQLLYRQTWIGLVGVLIVALTACAAMWPVVQHWKLSLWVGVSILLTLARGFVLIAFQRKPTLQFEMDRWATFHVLGVTFSGIMWALPTIFLWPAEYSVYKLVWPIFILPLSASAVATYYTWKSSYVSFIVLTIVPISVRFFVEGGILFNILGFLALFLIAVLLRAGRVMHDASLQAFEFGIRNEVLNTDLKEKIATEEQLNSQLQEEITERTLSEDKLNKRNLDLERLNEELKLTKHTLEASNRKLEDAITNIKQLSGMLPICASCKNIRNDKGYWEIIESYIRDHTGVEFSHSICPDCAKKLYPDMYDNDQEL